MTTTRQEMLDAINMKIAIKYDKEGCQAFSDICGKKGEDGKFLCKYCQRWGGQQREEFEPIMIGDVFKYMDTNSYWIDSGEGRKIRDLIRFKEAIVAVFYYFVGKQDKPLDAQDDDCISYIYNLLSND